MIFPDEHTPDEQMTGQSTKEPAKPVGWPSGDSGEEGLWGILADVSQGLQVSSGAIKAAVSSLLDKDIIWDRSTQHEFMQNINHSIDHVSTIMAIMTLAMKAESGRLEPVLEPSSIQEIISRVTDALSKEWPALSIVLALPETGKPAYVDYDYLRFGLRLLLEALISAERSAPETIAIRAEETDTHWHVRLTGTFAPTANELIDWFGSSRLYFPPTSRRINSEVILKLFTAFRLLSQQRITFSSSFEEAAVLTLVIPGQEKIWTSTAFS